MCLRRLHTVRMIGDLFLRSREGLAWDNILSSKPCLWVSTLPFCPPCRILPSTASAAGHFYSEFTVFDFDTFFFSFCLVFGVFFVNTFWYFFVPDSDCSSSHPSIKPAEVTDDITVLGRIKDNDEWVQRRTPGCNTVMEQKISLTIEIKTHRWRILLKCFLLKHNK